MSKFEVAWTPPRKNVEQKDELKEPTDVILGPFTAKAIVTFMDVPIGKTARRILRITSRHQCDTTVQVEKSPTTRLNLELEWQSKPLRQNATIEMELVWKPLEAGVFNEIILLTDDAGNKKDVKLIMKSIDLKKPVARRQVSTVSATLNNKKFKASPKRQVLSKAVLQQKNMLYKEVVTKKPTAAVSIVKRPKPLSESKLNVPKVKLNDKELVTDEKQKDLNIGKENTNPFTPPNTSDIFNAIQFTPGTEKIPKQSSCIDYLASLPTPKANETFKPVVEKIEAKKLILSPPLIESECSTNRTVFMTPCATNITRNEMSMLADLTTPKTSDKTVTIRTIDESKEIFTDAYDKLNFSEMGPSPSMERLSSETYIKCSASPCPSDVNDDQYVDAIPVNKTRTMTPPVQMCGLSMIEEESETDYTKVRSVTFQLSKNNETRVVESALLTPINRQIVSVSTKELFKPSPSKAWQGSMPNLLDDKSKQQLKNIENNRYFFQNVRVDESQSNVNESTVSTSESMFCASEIKAHSSRFNLNDFERSHENLLMTPAYSCHTFAVDRTTESVEQEHTPTKAKRVKQEHHSSPQLNTMSSVLTFSPPKRTHGDTEHKRDGDFLVPTASSRIRDWNAKKMRGKITSRVPLQLTLKKEKTEYQPIRPLFNPDAHLSIYINPDPFAPTIHIDPFLHQSSCLDDERRLDETQQTMKNWLNTLVAIPADLESHNEKIDVAKVFQEVQHKKDVVAESKEAVVSKFYKSRLDVLRIAAYNLFRSEEVSQPLRDLYAQIEKGHIQTRGDCDLSLQIGLQQEILDLLFCFNTLWLRIGLEAITNEAIPMKSNTDIYALAHFIIDRVFRDPYLKQAYQKRQIDEKTYRDKVKKHALKRILCLFFVLDQAKNKKIIKQNPCLFIKSAPHKQTKDILINFSSKILGRMGDITKHLKRFGYVLTHKQSYLDEFDYSFNNLMVDLRDGVRLVKLMEIINLREDLSCQLRVPAISLLQKVHNIELGFKALADADYQITGDISAKEIAQGHFEKTLSLLWQILYKFRAPKFNEAALVIQKAWMKAKLRFTIARRITERRIRRQNEAAVTIQRFFRGHRVRKSYKIYRTQVINACIVIQKNIRRYQAVKKYRIERLKQSQEYCACKIQSIFKMFIYRKQFLIKREATIVIQRFFRSYLMMKRTREYYRELRTSTITIQRQFRAKLAMRVARKEFVKQKQTIIKVQQKFRATKLMRVQRQEYLAMKSSAITIQRKLRATLQMRHDRTEFVYKRTAVIIIQQRFRANLLMRQERAQFLQIRHAATVIQNRYRANQAMKHQRLRFVLLKLAAESLQTRYRALIEGRKQRAAYLQLKQAALIIQERFRANQLMKHTRLEYLKQKTSATIIQKKFRATLLCKKQRSEFLRLKSATISIQRHYRALILMRQHRQEYLTLKQATVVIQKRFRAQMLMKNQRSHFVELKKAAIVLQTRFRALRLMKTTRTEYLNLKTAAVTIQRQYRARLIARKVQSEYQTLKRCAINVQQRYRALKAMHNQRQSFIQLKQAAVIFQRRFRAKLAMKAAVEKYATIKRAAVVIQQRYRARKLMKQKIETFVQIKTATITLQRQFRAVLLMRKARKEFLLLKSVTIMIQQKFRANILMRQNRQQYLTLKRHTTILQTRFRANLLMKQQRQEFLLLKQVTIMIQMKFRANKAMLRQRDAYQRSRNAIIRLQQRFRSLILMKQQRREYLTIKTATITIQRRYRATQAMKSQQYEYLRLKLATIIIQRQLRATLQMRQQRSEYLKLKTVTIICQRRFRETLKFRSTLQNYHRVRNGVIAIQRSYRGYKLMQQQRAEFLQLRHAAIRIQQQFRANKLALEQRRAYLLLKALTVRLQTHCRGYLARESYKAKMTPEMLELRKQQKAAKVLQAAWRGYCVRKKNSNAINELRKRVVASQRNRKYNQSVKCTLSQAMKVLKGQFNVYNAIGILKRLERISRIYPAVLIQHAGFVVSFCYGLMAQAIRSEPDKQLIEYCAQVVLNLARYEPTKEFAFLETGLTTISQMLLRWCDKECGIFITLCTLIWLLGHSTVKRDKIRRFMITQDALYMLRETKKLTIRKENMRKTVSKPFGCHLTQVPASVDPRALPAVEPDYGIIRGRPYVFYSPSFALETIYRMFDIDI